MQLITDLKPLRLYSSRRKIYIPFNPDNRRKGGMIQLLTRDLRDSVNLMNLPYLHNPKLYYSYYMVKNATAYIDSKGIIDHDAEDPDDALIEAVMHKIPGGNSISIECMGSPRDEERMKEIFHPKKVGHWLKVIGQDKAKINVTVYGFDNIKNMAKAINQEAIVKYGDFMQNSYCSPVEIFVLTEYAFNHSIKSAELDYEAYCTNELITYLVMTTYHTSRQLANYFGTGLSGQANLIKAKYKEKGEKITDDIGIALLIKQAYDDRGSIVIKDLLINKRYTILSKYHATNMINYADGLLKMFGNVLKTEAHYNEDGSNIFNESTGTHLDCVRIYKAMDPQDQKFLSGGYDYIHMPGKQVAYRNVIRGEGILKNLKAFVEVTYDYACAQYSGVTGSVIIGVHPKFRREGLGEQLVKTMLKEIRKECPEIGNLIWRVNPDNISSQKLAKKCGFKMVRQNKAQYMLRYEFNETPYYRYLDDKVMDEVDLLSYLKKFKLKNYIKAAVGGDFEHFWTLPGDDVMPLKDIARSMSGNTLSRAMLTSAYLDRMGLWNRIVGFIDLIFTGTEDKPDFDIQKIHFCNVYTYTNKMYYVLDSSLRDYPIPVPNVHTEHFNDTLHVALQLLYAGKINTNGISTLYISDYPYIYNTYKENKTDIITLSGFNTITNFRKIIECTTPIVECAEKTKINHLPIPRMVLNEHSKTKFDNDGSIDYNGSMITSNGIFFMNEIDSSYDSKVKWYIYKERLRTNKDLLDYYNKVKAMDPKIKKTFLKLNLYRSFNLFVDLSYYNDLFLNKMPFIKDKAVKLYWDFMERLLKNSVEMDSMYPYQTILIPISNQAWRVTPGTNIWDYRQNINPISVIMRLLRTKSEELIRVLGRKRIVFVGNKGYFLVDFANITGRNYVRLKKFITKLAMNEEINETTDDSEDDEIEGGYNQVEDVEQDTPAATAMKIIDKVEKSTGTKINNVSSVIKTNTIETTKSSITSTIPIMRIQDTKLNIGNSLEGGKKAKKGDLLDKTDNIGIGIFSANDEQVAKIIIQNININKSISNIITFKK